MNWYKSILTYLLVTLAAVGVVEGGLALVKPGEWAPFDLPRLMGTGLAAALMGALASYSTARRLRRVFEISQGWLRGNLTLRIADAANDELGQLCRQLDLIAGQFEKDEQDLAELRERNARLTDQVRALAVVEERNRLARELHDGVKQSLFSLAMTASAIRAQFEQAQPGSAHQASLAEMIRQVETTAQAAQREMTRLIADLRPGPVLEQGLMAALNTYTLIFGAQEHLLIYLKTQGNDRLLPMPVAEALYRVAQEALHNAARHARATRVDVNLRCLPEQVILSVCDNGVGFDTSQPRRGLGLANMQERLMAVNGRLTLTSQPGCGTTVLAEVGLSRPLKTSSGFGNPPDEKRPLPVIENWAWLGQKLVIPVGQTWPWHPSDQTHLRKPLVEPQDEPLTLKPVSRLFGLEHGYILRIVQSAQLPPEQREYTLQVRCTRSGYAWRADGATWALNRIQGPVGAQRMVLLRNGLALAAIQSQGRLANMWSELVYDGRGYALSSQNVPILADEDDQELLQYRPGGEIILRRALPLPLLIMAALRAVDSIGEQSQTTPSMH